MLVVRISSLFQKINYAGIMDSSLLDCGLENDTMCAHACNIRQWIRIQGDGKAKLCACHLSVVTVPLFLSVDTLNCNIVVVFWHDSSYICVWFVCAYSCLYMHCCNLTASWWASFRISWTLNFENPFFSFFRPTTISRKPFKYSPSFNHKTDAYHSAELYNHSVSS